MSPDEAKKIHITPSTKEINFARDFLIMEAQKIHYPEEYQCSLKGEILYQKTPN